MTLTMGVFAILWRVACLGLLWLILTELTWAQKYDGEALRRLRGVLAGMMFVIAFPLIGAIDSYTDISPWFELRPTLERWVWIGYATLATCLIRFWLALHAWARRQRENSPEK